MYSKENQGQLARNPWLLRLLHCSYSNAQYFSQQSEIQRENSIAEYFHGHSSIQKAIMHFGSL